MRYRTLGRTGLKVSEIGFGAWGIGRKMWKGAEDKESMRALHQAVDEGINFFDTALAYGDGHSETLIGKLLKETKEQIYVASKVPPKNQIWPARGTLPEVFPAHHIIDCAETSLRNLDADCLDLLQFHVWDPSWIGNPEWRQAISQLRQQGKIRHFGISINDHQPDTALEIVENGLVETVQVIFNIFDQSPLENLLPACQRHQVGVIARVPFDEGALTGAITPEAHFSRRDWRSRYFKGDRKQQVYDRVQSLLKDLGLEADRLPEMALRYCLHPPSVSTVIAGMRSTRHVQLNAAVSELDPLGDETLQILGRHRWEKNFYD